MLPTGVGKSLLAYGQAKILQARGLFLTSTNHLLRQYRSDFADMAPVMGMGNYPCKVLGNVIKCDAGPCLDGEACVYKEAGCDYFDAVKQAQQSKMPLSNYDFWFAHPIGADVLGPIDLLVCDEAHELPMKVAQAAGASFNATEVALPKHEAMDAWVRWAHEKFEATLQALEEPGLAHTTRRDLRSMLGRFGRLAAADPAAWAFEREERSIPSVRFEPIDPAPYAERILFRGIPKVLLMGATVRPQTLRELGIRDEEANFFESDSPIPVERRPIYWMPIGLRINAQTSDTNLGFWVSRMDQVIKPRLQTKGLIHTVSYARAKIVKEHSRYREHMLLHTGQSTREVVERFKRMPAPAILVSPSMHTGWDFPEDTARWQIIGKVPMLDTRFGIAAARKQANPLWPIQHAASTIVQITGRVTRGIQDHGETIIIDDTMLWLWSRYKPFFPLWWRKAFQEVAVVPAPPTF